MNADDDDSEYEWGMVDRMRLGRHDALTQHLYKIQPHFGAIRLSAGQVSTSEFDILPI